MLVECSNIYMEDVFFWFYNHVMDSCGDGASVIICKNHIDASELFLKWFINKYHRKFWHPADMYDGIVNFHDSNENFIFANKLISLSPGDYTFLIKVDCPSYNTSKNRLKAISKKG